MQLVLFGGFSFGKNMEKLMFFRAAMAGLGKYRTGSYGRIGVQRVRACEGRQLSVICHVEAVLEVFPK